MAVNAKRIYRFIEVGGAGKGFGFMSYWVGKENLFGCQSGIGLVIGMIMYSTAEHVSEALLRVFYITLSPGAQYRVNSIGVAMGDCLAEGATVIELEVTRTTGSGDKATTVVSIEKYAFPNTAYTEPVVAEVLLATGEELAPATHPVVKYRVEKSFPNLIEISLGKFVRQDSDLYRETAIPQKKLANAIKQYAHSVDPERVLFLYDDTVFGSAKDGFLITDSAFYYHNGSREFCLRFNEIASVDIDSWVTRGDSTAVEDVLVVRRHEGPSVEVLASYPALKLEPFRDFIACVLSLTAEGHTKDVDGYVIVQEMPEAVKLGYLKLLVWLTYQDDGLIDERELSELQVLMTQLDFDAMLRHAVRSAIREPAALDARELAEAMAAEAPRGSEVALAVSLLKDAVRVHRATSEGSALDSIGVQQLAATFEINSEQLEFIEQACVQDEKILAGELSDSQMTASAKILSAKAAAVGVPIAAVYLSGSVVGLSAAGVTSGLAALGLGGILGLSSMVTGIGAVILLGVGVYKGMQWLMGSPSRDKASRRELMLQEVLRIHQKAIANLAEDITFFAEQLLELTRDVGHNKLLIDKLSRELTVFANAMTRLRSREGGFEQELVSETEKRAI